MVSSAPEYRLKPALEATGLEHVFQTVVSGDDVYRGRPDPEAYLYAAQQLGRPSIRCVVIGNSNQVCSHSVTSPVLNQLLLQEYLESSPIGQKSLWGQILHASA